VARIDVLIGNSLPLYREVLSSTLRIMRPDLRVLDVPPELLHEQVDKLHPQVVICSVARPTMVADELVWITLFPEDRDEALVTVTSVHRVLPHATMDQLFRVIDDVLPNGETSSTVSPSDRNHSNE